MSGFVDRSAARADHLPIPRFYLWFAAVAAVVLLVGGFQYASPVVYVLSAIAPAVALRWPRSSLVLCTLIPASDFLFRFGWPVVSVCGLLAAAVCASWRTPRVAWVFIAAAVLFPIADVTVLNMVGRTPVTLGRGNSSEVLPLYVVAGIGVGAFLPWWRTIIADRSRLAAERLGVALQASQLDERSRLARDLHDVVAHHISLIAVRAETAPYTVPTLQPEARVVLAEIADHSRLALDELRGVLGVLRRGADADRAPQPTGADVVELVAKAQAIGPVELSGADVLASLDATRGYVAYRVVQEALTNARRHAPGSAVVVSAVADDGLLLRVTNRADGVDAVAPGRGLTGMRERVEALGGTMSADVRGGDVVVEVRLP